MNYLYTVEPSLTVTSTMATFSLSRQSIHTLAFIFTAQSTTASSPQQQGPLKLVPTAKAAYRQQPVNQRLAERCTQKPHFVL